MSCFSGFWGELRQVEKRTAAKQVATIITVGVGRAASATIGDKMVIERAVTLQIPNTVPSKCVGKYSKVAI